MPDVFSDPEKLIIYAASRGITLAPREAESLVSEARLSLLIEDVDELSDSVLDQVSGGAVRYPRMS